MRPDQPTPPMATKNAYQLQNFLEHHTFKSEKDYERIAALCELEVDTRVKLIHSIDPENGITMPQFLDWFDNGFGCGDICEYEGETVICGFCGLRSSVIASTFSDDKLLISEKKVDQKALKRVSADTEAKCLRIMRLNGLQFDYRTCKLVKRHIPGINERVIFTDGTTKGLGVVKGIDPETGAVDLYCYFLYGSGRCGYSMDERGVCDLDSFTFVPMDNSSKGQLSMNGISCRRRLNAELAKHRKTWNEKLHRVEPAKMRVERGERYFFMNDKLAVLSDVERNTSTSDRRYYAGNYFRTLEQAMEAMGRVRELIRTILAEDSPYDVEADRKPRG